MPEGGRMRCSLLADVGGTNCRLALWRRDDGILTETAVANDELGDPANGIAAWLDTLAERPAAAWLAVAGPVTGGHARLTNRDWTFDAAALSRALAIPDVRLVNDFAATAAAAPSIGADERRRLVDGMPIDGAPLLVLGPGTGLGAAILVRGTGETVVVPTEGGHIAIGARDDRDAAVLDRIRATEGRVSAEMVASGPGLMRLYRTLHDLAGRPPPEAAPKDISTAADAGEPLACETLRLFAGFFGQATGDLALATGARGGVLVAGGVVGALGEQFNPAAFGAGLRERRAFAAYLPELPVDLVTIPVPAFRGLAALATGAVRLPG